MEKYVVCYYEFGKHYSGCDMYFNDYESAFAYVEKQRKFNREERLNGISYKIYDIED